MPPETPEEVSTPTQPTDTKAKNILDRLMDGSIDIFEEARLMFFGAVACLWLTLILCHWLKEIPSFGGICGAIAAMFTALIAKMAWGKND